MPNTSLKELYTAIDISRQLVCGTQLVFRFPYDAEPFVPRQKCFCPTLFMLTSVFVPVHIIFVSIIQFSHVILFFPSTKRVPCSSLLSQIGTFLIFSSVSFVCGCQDTGVFRAVPKLLPLQMAAPDERKELWLHPLE